MRCAVVSWLVTDMTLMWLQSLNHALRPHFAHPPRVSYAKIPVFMVASRARAQMQTAVFAEFNGECLQFLSYRNMAICTHSH